MFFVPFYVSLPHCPVKTNRKTKQKVEKVESSKEEVVDSEKLFAELSAKILLSHPKNDLFPRTIEVQVFQKKVLTLRLLYFSKSGELHKLSKKRERMLHLTIFSAEKLLRKT